MWYNSDRRELFTVSILNERLKERRLAAGKTLLEAAEYIGVKEATMQRYESGSIKNVKHETICALAEFFHCSPQYLMGWDDCLEDLPLYKIQTQSLPILGNIACGEPVFADENHDIFVKVGDHIRADFCLIAKGDSMIGARIHDGDIVFIRKQPLVENGEIAAVLIDNEATLKCVHYDRDSNLLSLFPENPNYKTMHFSGDDLNRIRILGKAVAFQGKIF